MYTGFDKSALTYDVTFTNSNIGRYLRKRVHSYLEHALPNKKKLRVLELNCGTGEDAIYLAKKGHFVVASDSSVQMLEAAKRKAGDITTAGLKLRFEQIDMNNLRQYTFSEPFDLVFSDFGGLNCISPEGLKKLSRSIQSILFDNGRFIAVVMSKYCQWEIGYYLLKGKAGKSFRRRKAQALDVNVEGAKIKTYYYTPNEFKKIFTDEFRIINKSPVGLFLPPTYMESYFKKRRALLSFLNKLESITGSLAPFAVFGDHFLADMKVKL